VWKFKQSSITEYPSSSLENQDVTGEEIDKAKQSPSFKREYNLKYLGKIGNVFHTKDIETALEDTGLFEVDVFNDPQLALSGFYSNLYDLALLDIKMSQMDGFNLCRRLMKTDNRIKVCFLTAADLSYYEEIALEIR
jgi:PleD family two-component response regulator